MQYAGVGRAEESYRAAGAGAGGRPAMLLSCPWRVAGKVPRWRME